MTFIKLLVNKINFFVAVLFALTFLSISGSMASDEGDYSASQTENTAVVTTSDDWDIDNDGRADALTDGLLFLRYAFGLTGEPLISGVVASDAQYTTASDLEQELAAVYASSGDIDGNGSVDALTDGLLLLRYLFGLDGGTLTTGVIGSGATLTDSSALEAYMGAVMPQAPYITLNGSAAVNHEQATSYADAGATATDFLDGTVTVSMTGSVDSDTAGVYTLSYSATDSEGNVSRILTRAVTVADTIAPVITLLGELTLAVEQDATYTDAGAIATDTVDGSVTVMTTGSVDTATPGTYTLTYTATDIAGNEATVTRIVTVNQSQATLSVATLMGNWSLTREAGALVVKSGTDTTIYWSNSEIDVWRRACLFDDVYTFGADGSFSQGLGGETWLEAWQGTSPEACGTPVAPHDGSFDNGSYTVSDTSITINGTGAHLGLAKVINGAELTASSEAPSAITYDVTDFANDGASMILRVNVGDNEWRFKLSKSTGDPEFSAYGTGLDKVLNVGEVVDFNTVDTDYGLIDFGGTVSSIVADPIDASNSVVSVTKGTETEVSETWAGTTMATGKVFYPLTTSKTGITVRVWSPEAGTNVKLKLEQSGVETFSVETDATTTVAAGWETLTFDFANHSAGTAALDASKIFDTLIIYFNFDTAGSGETYYFDDVRFIGAVPVSVVASELVGNWKLAPIAGAISVGVSADNLTSYSNSIGDVGTRSCLFDDLFVFGSDGSFTQEMGAQTWVETWQGATAEGCALPVAPHNGSATDATYSLADTKLTVTGLGAHLGLPKVTNQGELNAEENPPAVPNSITYTITSFSNKGQNMTVQIDYGTGVWQFKFVKTDDTAPTETIEVQTSTNSSGFVYVIGGVEKKELALVVGTTYTFTYSVSHPFRFSTTSDGSHSEGSQYTAGVDTSVSGQITIKVTSSTPTILYYFCSVHAGMGGKIIFAGASVSDVIRIEAESFSSKIQNDDNKPEPEDAQDEGGGQNLGWFDAGDWVEYSLPIAVAGNYRIDYRVASQGGSTPGLNVKINSVWVDAVEIPNTGGWQSWQSVQGRIVTLEAGNQTLRVEAASGGTNINWFSFIPTETAADAPPEETVTVDPLLAGDWTLLPEAAALGVGPSSGNIGWWSNSVEDVTTRACLFDDIFRFGSDGSFANVMGDETWLEGWQGGSEACATPVAPHDGSNNATFVFDSSASTITVTGVGAHLGLPKVVNAGELDKEGISVPESITYEIVASTTTSMTIEIGYGSGYWTFKLVKVADTASAVSKSLSHNDLNRSYITYVPNTYDGTKAFPVLFNFHGFGGDAGSYLVETNMHYAAHSNNYILVYPQGENDADGSSHWNPCPPSADNKSDVDDLGFVEALLSQVSSNYLVDNDRVYSVGYSNGGMMSYGLARHKSSLFAAFGSVSGTMLDCGEQPSHPMPVIVMHGTNDGTLPYDGNSYYTSIESTLDYWNAFNNTDASPKITSALDVGENGSSIEIERYEYGQGDKDSSVEHYKVIGGGHDWFNWSFDGQQTNNILLNFFSLYDLSALR